MTESIKAEILLPQKDYAEAKLHSKKIDDRLGLNCDHIENLLSGKNKIGSEQDRQFWYGLAVQSLQTPYSEIVEMIQFIKPKDKDIWVDLGAGYGRMGLTLGFVAPSVNFVGYEFVQARVEESNRVLQKWGLTNATMKQADISSDTFQLDKADLFFLYDFGSKNDVYTVLEKLRALAKGHSIQVVARGRGVRSWIFMDCPWLSQMRTPVQFPNWTFFQS